MKHVHVISSDPIIANVVRDLHAAAQCHFRRSLTTFGMTCPLKKTWSFIVGIIILLLTGCGFHLRGMVEMPPWLHNVSIVMQTANKELEPLLSNQLKAYRINVASDPSLADYWLIIEQDGFQQHVGSISSSTTPRQYQLFYTVQFKLQHAKGKEVMPTTHVVVTRQITINSNRILGSINEEEQSKNEMRQDAAIQIIGRLSRIHEH